VEAAEAKVKGLNRFGMIGSGVGRLSAPASRSNVQRTQSLLTGLRVVRLSRFQSHDQA
jgi:hypothetical protein